MHVPPSPPSIAVPASGGFSYHRHCFRFCFAVPFKGRMGSIEAPAAATTVTQRTISLTSTFTRSRFRRNQ